LNFSFTPEYKRYANSEKYQGVSRAAILLSPGYSGNKQNPSFSAESNFQFLSRVQFSSSNRFFLADGIVLEVNPGLILQSNSSNREIKTSVDTVPTIIKQHNNSWQPSVNSSLQLLIGTGRIDEVTDAMLACYMLEDLVRTGSTLKEASPDDINSLATRITQLKNQRFFDARRHKIEEIESIDSLLYKRGIRRSADAAYFTSLNDSWDNGQNHLRYSGYRFYVGLQASADYYAQNTFNSSGIAGAEDTKFRNSSNATYLGGIAGIDWQKPHTLCWQSSLTAELQYGSMHALSKVENFLPSASGPTDRSEFTQPGFDASAAYTLGYYPNTRTYLSCGLVAFFDNVMNGRENNLTYSLHTGVNDQALRAGPRLTAYFYLSERVRLQLIANADYLFSRSNSWEYYPLINSMNYRESHTYQGSITGQLVYSIF
jgi:hypothetical protein